MFHLIISWLHISNSWSDYFMLQYHFHFQVRLLMVWEIRTTPAAKYITDQLHHTNLHASKIESNQTASLLKPKPNWTACLLTVSTPFRNDTHWHTAIAIIIRWDRRRLWRDLRSLCAFSADDDEDTRSFRRRLRWRWCRWQSLPKVEEDESEEPMLSM